MKIIDIWNVGSALVNIAFCLYVCLHSQNWNYFADNEADSVKMMEEVEKLCDRLELTRYIQQQDHYLDEF